MTRSRCRQSVARQFSVCRLLSLLMLGLVFVVSLADNEVLAAESPLPGVQATIEANEQAFLKAVLAQDKAALDTLLVEDFVYVHENGLISTKQQFLSDFVTQGYVAAAGWLCYAKHNMAGASKRGW